jgi:hypothetical protein
MKFYSSNHSINIRKSIGTLIHKVGVHLGMCGLFPHTLSHSWECECEYLVTLSAHTFPCFALITSPKLRSWHFQTFQLSPSFFSTSFRIQLGLPHTSIAGIFWCVHTSHRLYGYPPLTLCSWQQTHWNPWCNSQHLGTIVRDVGFHVGQQLHAPLSITSNSFHQRVDIMFSKDGICTLVDIVIVDPK